jgi:hypothetical protein
VLQAMHNIPGAPPGAYWDGGITDYHLHLNYAGAPGCYKNSSWLRRFRGLQQAKKAWYLYPHFQKSVVPGWLDKHLKWRHKPTHFLDTVVLLAPNPQWVKTLAERQAALTATISPTMAMTWQAG